MSKGKKFILILVDLFLITTILPLFLYTLGKFDIDQPIKDMSQVPYIGPYLPTYFLFATGILGILLLILLLVIIFYPKRYTGFVLGEGRGELLLKKSAIEGFVRETLKENGYIKDPKIDTLLGKNKIKLAIKGEIIPRVQISEKSLLIEEEIRKGLKEFLGVNHHLSLKIKVNAVTPKSKSSSRVL
ncbi:alkaline shock response membrane anchor protein AmaP [Lactococcus garvieae]|uniref:alkaline shock response membrane anchor protein AmaP n=1 Tax=Lactococcus formosensis TaxID=1281486 RepID=UPI0013FE3FF6|nr:alkaline shock response membrane anchor protein AmaP [Lactococcus formosensis]NHI67771.1 alkaline shock response membrane anchor protein AmaP [Lactococcus garvieae]NHI99104.1 alkaline shock response membrane anchor protein AmaP [Lactococcus garvieae]NHJ18438.1 alkaline shock response membrane anchor protein AmaP [Lactococcus garvieae]